MNELLSIGGFVGGAAICLYAIKMPSDAKIDPESLEISPSQILEEEKRAYLKNKGKKLPEIPGKTVVALETVSSLWKEEVRLADAANLWREPEEAKEEISRIPRPKFGNSEIEAFFVEYVMGKPSVKGSRRNVIITLLKMLDSEGDCPSVVRKGETEPERNMPNKTFDVLAKVPLWQHTLDVARLFAAKTKNDAILADILIIALGHDIGKIGRHYNTLYSTADHPQISVNLLNGISEFASLPNKSDISKAIAGHHLLKTNDPMTAMLMQVDAEARQETFGRLYDKQVGVEAPSSQQADDSTGEVPKNQLRFRRATTNALGEATATPSAFVEREDDRGYKPKIVALPDWFISQRLLDAISPQINKLTKDAGGKDAWVAVSHADIVYLREDRMWELLEGAGGESDPVFLAAGASENSRRDFLRTVTEKLISEDLVEKEYVPAGNHATYTTIVSYNGKATKLFTIPFKASAFGKLPSELKASIDPKLSRAIAKIVPES